MSQLIFQPALDPFHAIFRVARILGHFDEPIVQDKVRIMDFYLLFPFRIRTMRLMPRHQKFKRLSIIYASLTPYGEQPEPPLLFGRMEPMQLAAFETLASKFYINPSALASGLVQKTERDLPSEVAERASALNEAQPDLMEFLGVLASEYDLTGENGLKARSGLMEYRYDAV
ncbi:MAG TPA: ABC-three component system middle component 5 [Pseudolabrys sp.]